MAPRPLPVLRRRHHVLGARRDGADARRHRRDRSAGRLADEARRVGGRSTSPTRTSALAGAPARVPARARASARPAAARSCSRRGGPSSSGSATPARSAMVFEDLQWADAGLLDFIESLLEWSRDRPIFVLTLARPELADRRPTWGAGSAKLLVAPPRAAPRRRDGRAGARAGPRRGRRGRRPDRRARRGRPALRGGDDPDARRPRRPARRRATRTSSSADLGELDVPETLHALIASRLDAPRTRRSRPAAGRGRPRARASRCEALVGGDRVRASAASSRGCSISMPREFLSREADPRSPERGQYAFVQSIIREIAYGMLSKADRRSRHLAVAHHFEAAGDDELAGGRRRALRRGAQARPPTGPDRDALARPGARLARPGGGSRGRARLARAGAGPQRAGAGDHPRRRERAAILQRCGPRGERRAQARAEHRLCT